MTPRHLPLCAGAALLAVSTASAINVRVTIENIAPSSPTGLYFTPVWTGFHNGGFDLFNVGSAASPALETVAEVGDPGSLDTLFGGSVTDGISAITANPSGPAGVIYDPGAAITFDLNLDPTNNRFLSFASMLVPSNDTFFAADGLEIFDGSGTLVGGSWTFAGTGAYDAGTEDNDLMNGPAFVSGETGTDGMATVGGLIALQSASAISDLGGVLTAAGTTIGTTTGDVFRLSVTAVPEPSALGFLIGLGALFTIARRRR